MEIHDLGPQIGEGATADVFAYGDGTVLKLFKPGYSKSLAAHETAMTRAAAQAGAPAPAILDELIVAGRQGVVMTLLAGPSLEAECLSGTVTPQAAGQILAGLHHAVHRLAAPARMPPFSVWASATFNLLGSDIPEDLLAQARKAIDTLPQAETLCHGDLHPGNVLMTPAGPRVVDWMNSVRAPPEIDLARCWLTHVRLPHPERQTVFRRLGEAYVGEYARLAGVTEAALMERIVGFLPAAAAVRLTETVLADDRPVLEAYVRGG